MAEEDDVPNGEVAEAPFTVPVISSGLAEEVAGADPSSELRVIIRHRRPAIEQLSVRFARSIGLGQVSDHDSAAAVRESLLLERADAIADIQAPIVAFLEERGATIASRCRVSSCIVADLSSSLVEELAAVEGVVSLERDLGLQENNGGTEVRAGAQIVEMLEAPNYYDGEGPTGAVGDDIWGATIEKCGARTTHRVFNDDVNGNSRLSTMDCSSGTCQFGAGLGAPCYHATADTGTLIGDTEDLQIAGVTGFDASGFAPEARAIAIKTGTFANMVLAFDALPFYANSATSMSISLENNPPYECSGTESAADALDELYENGRLIIMAAGNDGGAGSECRVEQPGSAAAAFTVGALEPR